MANRIENFSDEFDTVPMSEWIQAVVPDTDVLGDTHPGVKINDHNFPPGVYLVPPSYAREIKGILKRFDAQTVRRLQPHRDIKAIRDQEGEGASQGASIFPAATGAELAIAAKARVQVE
jgi:hypothetical protein